MVQENLASAKFRVEHAKDWGGLSVIKLRVDDLIHLTASAFTAGMFLVIGFWTLLYVPVYLAGALAMDFFIANGAK